MIDEAVKTASVLGYNFPGSKWYELSYNLLKDNGKDLKGLMDEDQSDTSYFKKFEALF